MTKLILLPSQKFYTLYISAWRIKFCATILLLPFSKCYTPKHWHHS